MAEEEAPAPVFKGSRCCVIDRYSVKIWITADFQSKERLTFFPSNNAQKDNAILPYRKQEHLSAHMRMS